MALAGHYGPTTKGKKTAPSVEGKLPIGPAGVSGGLWFSADALSVEVAVGGQSKFKSQMSFSCTVGGSKHSVESSTRLIGAGPQYEQNS